MNQDECKCSVFVKTLMSAVVRKLGDMSSLYLSRNEMQKIIQNCSPDRIILIKNFRVELGAPLSFLTDSNIIIFGIYRCFSFIRPD